MKRLALLVLLMAAACAPGSTIEGPGTGGLSAINYIHDEAHGVSCWIYTAGSISCLPDSQVRLP